MWDVVIARPIHHAVPAGMRWGQFCTTQLQPVLVCCARLHCVPTMFCCLLLHLLCSHSLVFPLVFPPLHAVLSARVQWQISLPLSPLCFIIFELAREAIAKRSAATFFFPGKTSQLVEHLRSFCLFL